MVGVINNKSYYIKIKGYYRMDGTWVSSHYRRIKFSLKSKNIPTSTPIDPNQLSLTL